MNYISQEVGADWLRGYARALEADDVTARSRRLPTLSASSLLRRGEQFTVFHLSTIITHTLYSLMK